MKKQITKLGFTLIELLVVITIIGILATGATSVYTSQIQKARDSNRITDVKALEGAFEQAYSDASIYPTHVKGDGKTCNPEGVTASDDVKFGVGCLKTLEYLPKFPTDKKLDSPASTASGGSTEYLGYAYDVASSSSNVELQTFEISTAFEAKASLTSKARNKIDGGNNANRYEAGNNVSGITTDFPDKTDVKSDCTYTANKKGLSITESCGQ